MKTILVIEDDLILQAIYENLLREWNFHLIMSSSIMEAADLVAEEDIDLIIADYNLPDSNSMVLLRLVEHWQQKIPTIIVTSNKEIRNESPEVDQLAKTIMFKPFSADQLQNCIGEYLS